MSKSDDYLFKGVNILAWIIFIGVCIDAGGVITNALYSIFFNARFSTHFWGGIDLYNVYNFNEAIFVTLVTLMSITTFLKATMFYLIVKIFHDKKLDLSKPFNATLAKYIYLIAYCAFGIGIFSSWGSNLVFGLTNQNVILPLIHELKMEGASIWFLMASTLLIFAVIFKKGIVLQSDNDLTV
jgi:Protein of unknown function (DUF2975)